MGATLGNAIAGQMSHRTVTPVNASAQGNLPTIALSVSDVVGPITFDAMPLIGPSTFASIGPALRPDYGVDSLPLTGERGARTVLAYRQGDRAFFVYGFAKNERDNIDAKELKALKQLAALMLGWRDTELAHALHEGALIEVSYDKPIT